MGGGGETADGGAVCWAGMDDGLRAWASPGRGQARLVTRGARRDMGGR